MKCFRSCFPIILLFLFSVNLIASNSVKTFPSHNYGYVENKGQFNTQDFEANSQVLFLLNAKGINVQLKRNGFSLEMVQVDSVLTKFHRIDLVFEGANTNCVLEPSLKAPGYINYYLNYSKESGVPAGKGQTRVAHYGKVTYKDIYPGIDIEFLLDPKMDGVGYKYNFVVKSGASLSQVKMKVLGAQDLTLNAKGNIVYTTSLGTIEESIPHSYLQNEQGSKEDAKVYYELYSKESFGLTSTADTKTSKLVVDPIGWATYFGSSSLGNGPGVGISSPHIANITVAGKTHCSVGIATFGAYLGSYQSSGDVFLTMFSNSGVQIWGTYYGGSAWDLPYALDIDTNYNSYICGSSISNSGIATTGSYMDRKGSSNIEVGFLSKFDSSGYLVWGTYLSDSSSLGSIGWSLSCTKSNGRIFVASNVAGSVGLATSGTHSTIQFGGNDLLLYSFDENGSRIWSTYFGGPGPEFYFSIRTNELGQSYVCGYTTSTAGIITTGAHKNTITVVDGFIAKFDSTGNRMWGTYYGGNNYDTIWDITLDAIGNFYICGSTNSTIGIATGGTYQTVGNSINSYAFVNKFNAQGVRQWGTYYSGNLRSKGTRIAVDMSGNIVLTGTTNSTTGIATANTSQTTLTGYHNAFLAKLNPGGTARLWGTYFGGNKSEIINDVFINQDDEIYITGETNSTTGFATLGAHQTVANTNYSNTFIAVLSPYGGMPVTWESFEANAYTDNSLTKAILHWSTASESNNDYFTIERSYDAETFEAIGTVKGAGNSSKINRYSFRDDSPFKHEQGNQEVYYRIKQTDFDGRFDYSALRKLSIQESQVPIKILYQDNIPMIDWGTNASENCELELINLAGQIVWHTKLSSIPSFAQTPITTQTQAGIYLLRIKSSQKEECFKIVVE